MTAPAAAESSNTVHASAVVIGEAGVVIRGRSGSGKSALALALIDLANERGLFGRLVGDDRIQVRIVGGRVLISGAPEITGLAERRGVGLVRTSSEPVAVARLVIDILDKGATAPRLPEPPDETTTISGVMLPRLVFDGATQPYERARIALAAAWEQATAL